jgi:hypothetical protein
MRPGEQTDSAFVDGVMARVRAASPSSDEEELFPGGTASRSVPAVTLDWGERALRAMFVVAAVLFLALRVSMLGSVLAGSSIDEAPSGVSQTPGLEVDDV